MGAGVRVLFNFSLAMTAVELKQLRRKTPPGCQRASPPPLSSAIVLPSSYSVTTPVPYTPVCAYTRAGARSHTVIGVHHSGASPSLGPGSCGLQLREERVAKGSHPLGFNGENRIDRKGRLLSPEDASFLIYSWEWAGLIMQKESTLFGVCVEDEGIKMTKAIGDFSGLLD